MATDFVSREAAIAEFCDDCMDKEWCEITGESCSRIKNINAVPAADVRPVVHGNWMHGKETGREYLGDCLVGIFYDKWTCSECGYVVDDHAYSRINYNFCPHCGVDMREPHTLEIASQNPNTDVMTPATSKCKVKKIAKNKERRADRWPNSYAGRQRLKPQKPTIQKQTK